MNKENQETGLKIAVETRLKIFMQYADQQFEYYLPGVKNTWFRCTAFYCLPDCETMTLAQRVVPRDKLERVCVRLKTLGGISHAECVEAYDMLFTGEKMTPDEKEGIIRAALGQMRLITYHNRYDSLRYNEVIKLIDFLRSRGYAMPYGPYSVEQLVEAGIYKLTIKN